MRSMASSHFFLVSMFPSIQNRFTLKHTQLQDKDAVLPAVVQTAHKRLIGQQPLRSLVVHIQQAGFQLFIGNADGCRSVPPSVVKFLLYHHTILYAVVHRRMFRKFQKTKRAVHGREFPVKNLSCHADAASLLSTSIFANLSP